MSTLTNRISTVFTASAGNVRAVMGEVAGGMQNIGRASMQTSRQTGYLSNQLRAMGTTLRYAIAGTAVFGATGLVRSLSTMQTQMALMSTLADKTTIAGQQMFGTAQGLRGLMDELQRSSLEALTPVNELGDSVVNLLSSVQGVSPDEVTKITTSLAEGAQLAQTPVTDLTKAITGMNQAFGRRPEFSNFEALNKAFVTLTRRAPGGVTAGAQIINQLAPLAAVSRLARVSPQQMFGLLTTVLRTGGTPATSARGLQFLLQSIAAPNKAEAKELARVGITPEYVQRAGGVAAIRRLIRSARGMGIRGAGRLRNLSDEQLDQLDTMGMDQLQSLGISGQGVQFLQRSLGRIHGVRALVTLMTQQLTGPAGGGNFAADLQAADRAMQGVGDEGRAIADQFKDFRKQQPLRAAGLALQGLALQIPRALEGLLNPVARQVDRVGQLAMEHPRGTRHVIQGAAAFMAALGLARGLGAFRAGRGIRGFLGGITGGLGQRFVQERAISAATNPARAGVLGGSPQNPMFVIVVGEIFGGKTAGPTGPLDPNVPTPVPWWKRAGRVGTRVAPAAAGIAVGTTAAATAAAILASRGAQERGAIPERGSTLLRAGRMYERLWERDPRRLIIDQLNRRKINERQADIQMSAAMVQARRLDRLNRILAPFHRRDPLYGVTAIYSQRREQVHGKAMVVLDVNLSTAQGMKRKRIQVPMDLWSGGRTPSQRGQAGKVKGNVP
jgi:hypothetical protein